MKERNKKECNREEQREQGKKSKKLGGMMHAGCRLLAEFDVNVRKGSFCTFVGLAEMRSVTIAKRLTCMSDSRLSQSS